MADNLKIALAQLNLTVGDVRANRQRILETTQRARDEQCAMAVFTELALTGYPPEDLLLRPDFIDASQAAFTRLLTELPPDIAVVLGYPLPIDDVRLANAVSLLRNGRVEATYRKSCLPNYSVFDEKRYFTSGSEPCVVQCRGRKIGLTVCEDIWRDGPVETAVAMGAEVVININASPFHIDRIPERQKIVSEKARTSGVPIIYANQVGGQDELIFDGASFVVDAGGNVTQRAEQFEEKLEIVELTGDRRSTPVPGKVFTEHSLEESVYRALTLGVRDYIDKNGFPGAVVGLSGGIDSALTLAIAADALGPERVQAVLMPSRYTADMSLEDAASQTRALGVRQHTIPIQPVFESFLSALDPVFQGRPVDTTEENIQARCRGLVLMALSNKFGHIVLTTGNKSEMAVGYATLYGDMAGGFAVIKDVPKTLVYGLVRLRNTHSQVIPQRIIERPPSAELAPDQQDADSLPPYDELDPILAMYVEQDWSPERIVELGYDEKVVHKVVDLVDRNEYKRRQAPPGIRITARAFGRDRRYPITSGYRPLMWR
ncbi:MAG: Glutamine-dependent NAD(+) synthetase [Gammaproteobacteria bacterium]|nr:Glutamine-dependent NAD(+) synthetase [Gammaproteobacteria bacterium]